MFRPSTIKDWMPSAMRKANIRDSNNIFVRFKEHRLVPGLEVKFYKH